MTKEEIVKLAIENNLVEEVYDLLHHVMREELKFLHDKSVEMHSELSLIKKFADMNKLGIIKGILAEDKQV